jgi:Ca2+-transporting ATPase
VNQTRWHATPLADLLQSLKTTTAGLTSSEAEERLRRHGPNAISAAPGTSVAHILFRQIRSVVVALLFVAAVVSVVMGDSAEAGAILVVLVINTAIGFTVELRAHRAMEALLRYQALQARVRRDGMLRALSAQVLVPGDVIRLEEGDAIPADARLLAASELRVLESALTGESVAVEKEGSRELAAEVPLPDRTNMLFMGTTVVGGAGTQSSWKRADGRSWAASASSSEHCRRNGHRSSASWMHSAGDSCG